jgi:hypothetical protein
LKKIDVLFGLKIVNSLVRGILPKTFNPISVSKLSGGNSSMGMSESNANE